jgi:hypothetical protein
MFLIETTAFVSNYIGIPFSYSTEFGMHMASGFPLRKSTPYVLFIRWTYFWSTGDQDIDSTIIWDKDASNYNVDDRINFKLLINDPSNP